MVKKMKQWSGIHTWIRITTKSKPLLEGHPLPMPAKSGRRPFPRSSVILFTESQNDRKNDRTITYSSAEVNCSKFNIRQNAS